jgi:hypothetical protein
MFKLLYIAKDRLPLLDLIIKTDITRNSTKATTDLGGLFISDFPMYYLSSLLALL